MSAMTSYLDHLAETSSAHAAALAADAELTEMATLIAQVLTGDEWIELDFAALDLDTRSYLGRADEARSRGLTAEFLRRFADEDRSALIGFLTIVHELSD